MRLVRLLFSRIFICITVIAALIAAIIFLCVYIHSLLPAAVGLALFYVISLIAALALIVHDTPSEFKVVWLVVIVGFPIAGAALYFLSYLNRSERCARPHGYPSSSYRYCEYFADGADYLKRLTDVISVASKRIYLEYYIISKGYIWGAIYRELLSALKRGVEVKIIYDGLGSATKRPKSDFKQLKRCGAQIKVFNKLFPLPVSRLNFRDHRKIGVVDDCVFLGGVNIADEYANLISPHGHWKDGGACFTGEITDVYAEIFLDAFDCRNHENVRSVDDIMGATPILPLIDQPECKGSCCEDLLTCKIYSAKEKVCIFTPYLCAGDKLTDALTYAAERGTDVRIIIPAIPDKKITYAITRTYAEKLCARGVKVYTYTPGFMHFKGVVCDDEALLGSYNFDYRSMRLNHECGVWGSGEMCDRLLGDFNSCLPLCTPFKYKERKPTAKFFQTLLFLFAPLV